MLQIKRFALASLAAGLALTMVACGSKSPQAADAPVPACRRGRQRCPFGRPDRC